MGYRIDYEKGCHTNRITANKFNSKVVTGCIAGIFLAAILLATAGKERIVGWLIPGDDSVTKQAYNSFAEDLREGESFGVAFEAFCREIIENA